MCKEIVLTGTPYEMGYRHGSLCKAEVLNSLESYEKRFLRSRRYSWGQAKAIAQKFRPLLTGEYGRFAEEIQGIADGAGVDADDILTLNCRSEILYSTHEVPKEEPAECTAFSAVSPATKDGVTLAGQTWDYMMCQRRSTVIARFPAEGKMPARLFFLEAGMVGGKGVNSAGLALTLNALRTQSGAVGIPLHIRMRRILECRYLSDAYAVAAAAPIPFAANLILTHKDGVSLCLELDPSGCDVILPQNGIIVHTNHFYGPRMVLHHAHAGTAGTYVRFQMLDRLLRGKPELTAGDVEGFFRNHQGYPTSVCVHPHPDTLPENLDTAGATNYAFIADLTHGTVRFVEGNPCENEYRTLPIEPDPEKAR